MNTVLMEKFFVYMLNCVDDSYYIGITNNLKMRMEEHYNGFKEGSYTYKRLPVELVYSASFDYVLDAIAWEKRIKRWSRAKKEALINNDTNSLRKLSHSPNQPTLQRWSRCQPEPDEG